MIKRYRFAWMLGLVCVSSTAAAYIYDVGPNTVNMSGSACRTAYSSNELNVNHDAGYTYVKSAVALQRLFCPVSRRGTGVYGGQRLNNTYPPEVSALHVNISSAYVKAQDGSTLYRLSCYFYGEKQSDQSVSFGTTKYLCGSAFGCSFANVGSSWTGENTLAITPPANFNTVDSVNYGIVCDVPGGSSIHYTETSITPN